ncbi:hypothetical protein B0T14DRAFT_570300 [Immersiella caudata]|uniref:F-box domain-containing protein n=1 Tax=Immersiella caudata TaxID=314043 RepID=A0AA39WFC4_9PEZI|nr:hypothetical protein B0T14DRAFT_570300 [Immersiella caudata]
MPRRKSKVSRRPPKDIESDQRPDLPRGPEPHYTLSRLPLELIHNISSALNIPALCNLRRTCRTAKSVIDTYLPYQWLSAHHPWAIRAMVKAGATYPTCPKIYSSLRSETCSLCNQQLNLASNTFPDTTP